MSNEVIISNPEGRIEGRYSPNLNDNFAPAAIVLHPLPTYGGTMNNKVVYNTHKILEKHGFSVLRINFPGVGKSTGTFTNGFEEMVSAAIALDWLQMQHPTASSYWVAGFSFGAWVGLQIVMRRPEVNGFIAISPPANKYDFSFFSPCPCSGIVIQGDNDSVVTEDSVSKFLGKIAKQKNTEIEYSVIEGADHFFRTTMDELMQTMDDYINRRMIENSSSLKTKIDRRRKKHNTNYENNE